jgi:hypothetical protein
MNPHDMQPKCQKRSPKKRNFSIFWLAVDKFINGSELFTFSAGKLKFKKFDLLNGGSWEGYFSISERFYLNKAIILNFSGI